MSTIKMDKLEVEFTKDFVNDYLETEILKAKLGKGFTRREKEDLVESTYFRLKNKLDLNEDQLLDIAMLNSNDQITESSVHYSWLSGSLILKQIYKKVAKSRGYQYGKEYSDFGGFVQKMTTMGIYHPSLIEKYSVEELSILGSFLDKEKDKLFSYAGLFLLRKNYLSKKPSIYMGDEFPNAKEEDILELPQERFLTVAMYLLQDEDPSTRLHYIKEAYWALSNHYIGLATPTLTNAGRVSGTLSSCHILTIDDSLKSIFSVLDDTATFCQNGAGIGIYLGNLRADGSWIRNYKGRATGLIGPSKLFNVVAEYVDQLNQRKGGIALYLPVDHLDIFDFLDLRLKVGSQERRAQSILTGICIPDEFMRRLDSKSDWTLFDPYEVQTKLGFDLHAMYDKKKLKDGETPNKEDHAYTYHYRLAESADLELSTTIPVAKLYASIYNARKTSGTPYYYFSDTAARMNPNDHVGMPLCSNLCSEIVQNQSADTIRVNRPNEIGEVVITKVGEGLVTCNLSSLVVHNVFNPEVEVDFQRVADIQYRMLDAVISLDRSPVGQATHTNNLYRAVGAGTLGLATHLADMQIHWDSKEAIEYVDSLYEKIAFANIKASANLAVEKGEYPLFEGSKWHTGVYFEERGYDSEEWLDLKEIIKNTGIRNGYLMANAPTGSNSLIMNGSAGTQALFDVVYLNKKEEMNVTLVPVNYSFKTKPYYKSAFEMDEMWSIEITARMQKHVDQSISHDFQLPRSTSGKEMFRLDFAAWDKGMKSIYYMYTRKDDVINRKDCVNCEG